MKYIQNLYTAANTEITLVCKYISLLQFYQLLTFQLWNFLMAYANTYVLHSTICIFSLEVHCSDTVDWLLHLPLIFSITVYWNLSHQSDKTCTPSFQSGHAFWSRKIKHPINEVYCKRINSSEQLKYSSLLALHLLTACPSVHSLVLYLYFQSSVWHDMICYVMIWYAWYYIVWHYIILYIWYDVIFLKWSMPHHSKVTLHAVNWQGMQELPLSCAVAAFPLHSFLEVIQCTVFSAAATRIYRNLWYGMICYDMIYDMI
jgi:hypothetical protein